MIYYIFIGDQDDIESYRYYFRIIANSDEEMYTFVTNQMQWPISSTQLFVEQKLIRPPLFAGIQEHTDVYFSVLMNPMCDER